MQRIDRALGIVLALLATAVLWTARSFPVVPGQKVGAGFLPTLVGVGLLVGGLLLVRRSFDAARYGAGGGAPRRAPERWWLASVVPAAVLGYIALADRIGFLIVAPLMLIATLRAFGVGWRAALGWSVAGTLVVHIAFYKLLRVPLPWGVLRPWY
ncbi:MAG: tripartite tricarboxylate transporter TctB family protein [Burkholderiales bacterium]|nr:MAG: tripartite tricarboxylate transporter TctB family protein [Burkholderiales bacterium]